MEGNRQSFYIIMLFSMQPHGDRHKYPIVSL